MHLIITDPLHEWLIQGAQQMQRMARVPGTYGNQASAVKAYLAYTFWFGISLVAPTVINVCAFVQFIGLFLASPASNANYVSAVTGYLTDKGTDLSAFNSYRVGLALDAFYRDKSHVVNRRRDISEGNIKDIMGAVWRCMGPWLLPCPRFSRNNRC